MTGCANTAALRSYEKQQARTDRHERAYDLAVVTGIQQLIKVRIGSAACGSALIGEALSEQRDLIDRPLANLIHDALEGLDRVEDLSLDQAEVGRIVSGAVIGYLRRLAEHQADGRNFEQEAHDEAAEARADAEREERLLRSAL